MGKKEYLVISSPIGALKGYNNGKLSVVCFRNQERIRKHTVLVNNKTRTFYIILYLCITYIVYYIVIIFIYPSTLHACIYISQKIHGFQEKMCFFTIHFSLDYIAVINTIRVYRVQPIIAAQCWRGRGGKLSGILGKKHNI